MKVASTQEPVTVENASARAEERTRVSAAVTYGTTFATEFLVMLSQIALYKLVASGLGQMGFSEYSLVRRVVSFLQPVVMLGLGVGLPRFLALADGRGRSDSSSRYLWATILCVGGATGIIAAALMIWPGWFSYLLFGSRERQYLIPALAFMLTGISVHSILYAFLRGRLAVGQANALQLINYGLVPLIVFWFFHKDAGDLLWHLGFAWTATAGFLLMLTPVAREPKNPWKEARELLGYGLQRVPGEFAFIGLLALPAIFTAHLAGFRQAGLVAFGLAVVNMVASMFSPVGIILLPKVSRAVGSGDLQSVRQEIVVIRRLALLLASTIVIFTEFFGSRLIRIYLGDAYVDAGAVVNIVVIGALPLAFYSALRSAIDAIHYKAVNTLNVLATLTLFLAGCAIGAAVGSAQSFLWSFSGSLVVLACLTQREVQKALKSARMSVPAGMTGIRDAGLPESRPE